MSSHFRSRTIVLSAVTIATLAAGFLIATAKSARPPATQPARRVLRVAADPNNLPFSNERGEGFENKIAELIARELGAELQYTWHAQRRGFFRAMLKEGDCDLVMGVPSNFEMVLPTTPYYRSSYVVVRRASDRSPPIDSFDDPRLRRMRIGVQLIGDDGVNAPPAHALGRRGMADNVVGFTVYGDYRQPNPPARIVQAVAQGDVDIAIVWGPLAGYFAKQQTVPLEVTPLAAVDDGPSLPMAFDISMGVRRGDAALRDTLNQIIARRQNEIQEILNAYGVPCVAAEAGVARRSHALDER